MNIRNLLLALALPLAACAQENSAAPAPGAVVPAAAATDPRVALAAKIPGTRPEDLRATPLPGIYELTHGADISYISADGKYVFAGNLYQVSTAGEFPNLTEVRRRELRLKVLAAVPESQMLVFGPDNAAHTITVFTDIDCPWCQRLHGQIAEYNRLGIKVRYLFYPRSGPQTESWAKADAIWCAPNRNEAFTRAKRGEAIAMVACPASPVAREYQLGRQIGVTGTPGIVLQSGELVPGYLAPAQMLAHIRKSPAP
jgi:thiol:disulfide interchange protein DsbC